LKVKENRWGYYIISIDFGICYSMVLPLLTDFPIGLTIVEERPGKFAYPAGLATK